MLLRGIDTNLIVALHALLLERNVTRAAARVGLGQSSLSHALARLRAHFADPLLVLVGRSMVLTERAKALIAPVSAAVAQLERVFSRSERFEPASSERTFRIVGTDNLELYLLSPLTALVAEEAPKIALRFHHLPPDWRDALERGDADLKLGRKYPVGEGLHSQDLLDERLVCVVRKNHPHRSKRMSLDEYVGLDHVAVAPTLALGETYAATVDEVLARRGVARRIAVTVPHFLVAPFVAASSNLALTMSERVVRTLHRSLSLRVIELPFRLASYKLSQVWAERSHADEGHRWLRSAIARALCIDVSTPSMPRMRSIHGKTSGPAAMKGGRART